MDESAALDDELAADVEAVDAVGPGEDEAGDGVGRAGELERLARPDGEVGAQAIRFNFAMPRPLLEQAIRQMATALSAR